MSNGVNKVILIGRLGADPEVKHFDSGNTVARVSLATTEVYRDRDGNKQEKTEWHNVVMWQRLAEIVEQYLRKGDQIYVEGSLRTRSYEKNGETKYITEVVSNNMTMLGSKSGSSGASSQQSKVSEPEMKAEDVPPQTEDDLPF